MANAQPDRASIPDLLKVEARQAHQRIVEIGREVTARAPGLEASMSVVAHHASTMWAEGKPTSEAHSKLVLLCSEITLDRFTEDIRFRMTEIIGQAAKIEALIQATPRPHEQVEITEQEVRIRRINDRWGKRLIASILSIGCASAAACGFHAQGLEVASPMDTQAVASIGDSWTEVGDEAIGPGFAWVDQVPIGSGYDAPIWAG